MLKILAALLFVQGAAMADKALVLDLKVMKWFAVLGEQVIGNGKAIGGMKRCPEFKRSCKTPQGSFRVISKSGYLKRSSRYPVDCREKSKCGAKMYWFVLFHPDGIGIHGVTEDKLPDHHASHGCVRVSIEDAKWLNKNFLEIGTRVIVLSYE